MKSIFFCMLISFSISTFASTNAIFCPEPSGIHPSSKGNQLIGSGGFTAAVPSGSVIISFERVIASPNNNEVFFCIYKIRYGSHSFNVPFVSLKHKYFIDRTKGGDWKDKTVCFGSSPKACPFYESSQESHVYVPS